MSYARIQRTVFPDENLAAIVAALGNDTEVILAPGVHVLSATVDINNKSRFSIRGGPGAVVRYPFSPGHPFQFTNTCEDILLEGFRIENSFIGNNDGEVFQFQGGCVLRRITFKDLIVYTAATSGNFEYLWCDGDETVEDVKFVGCTFYGDHFISGFALDAYGGSDSFDGLTWEGCTFRAPTTGSGSFLNLAGSSGRIRNVTIHNNIFYCGNQATEGIRLQGVHRAVVAGNIIRDAVQRSIFIDYGNQDLVIEGNLCHTQTAASSPYGGITTEDSDTDIVIDGNVLENIRWDALRVIGDRIVVSNNLIRAVQTGVYVNWQAEDIVFDGNLVHGGHYGHYVESASRLSWRGGVVASQDSDEGIRFMSTSEASVSGVLFHNIADQCVELVDTCAHVSITGCAFLANTDGDLVNSRENCQHISVVGNRFDGATSDAIQVESDDTLVAHNLVRASAAEGIQLGGNGNYADRCNVASNASFGNGTDGIFLETSVESNVSMNRCYGNGDDGIDEDATGDQNLFALNHVRGNGTATEFAGTNRTEYNNKT